MLFASRMRPSTGGVGYVHAEHPQLGGSHDVFPVAGVSIFEALVDGPHVEGLSEPGVFGGLPIVAVHVRDVAVAYESFFGTLKTSITPCASGRRARRPATASSTTSSAATTATAPLLDLAHAHNPFDLEGEGGERPVRCEPVSNPVTDLRPACSRGGRHCPFGRRIRVWATAY